MKKLILLLVIGGLGYAGFKYINWDAVTGGGGSIFKSGSPYPITRTITSSDGRTLDVVILGKRDDAIFVQATNNGKEYRLERSRLSPGDSEYVASLPEGGRERAPVTPDEVEWYESFADASRVAAQYETPIFMLFDGSSW